MIFCQRSCYSFCTSWFSPINSSGKIISGTEVSSFSFFFLMYISTYICRRTERTRAFKIGLKINFMEGCGCSSTEINVPFESQVRKGSGFFTSLVVFGSTEWLCPLSLSISTCLNVEYPLLFAGFN